MPWWLQGLFPLATWSLGGLNQQFLYLKDSDQDAGVGGG